MFISSLATAVLLLFKFSRSILCKHDEKILADCERVAENLALDKAARQISTYVSPARIAVDGLTVGGGASCTRNDLGQPWWAVDLLQEYHLSHVVVTAPDFGNEYRKYRQSCFFEKINYYIEYKPGSRE